MGRWRRRGIGFHSTTDAGALTPSHIFTSAGVFTVTLTVRDDDGGVSTESKTVRIAPLTSDFDGNLWVDRMDLDILLAAIRNQSRDLVFDPNGDGVVNIADAHRLVLLFSRPRGLLRI